MQVLFTCVFYRIYFSSIHALYRMYYSGVHVLLYKMAFKQVSLFEYLVQDKIHVSTGLHPSS